MEKVVILTSDSIQHRYTISEFVSSGINVVGILIVPKKNHRKKIILRKIRNYGILNATSQVLAKVVYLMRNYRRDKQFRYSFFDVDRIEKNLSSFKGKTLICDSYHDPSALNWLKIIKPNILVVHSPHWVNRSVYKLSGVKFTIAGHPGITKFYRGSHSPFWCVFNGEHSKIGWTTFLLDDTMDGGSIIEDGNTEVMLGDTFEMMSLRGNKKIVASQIKFLQNLKNIDILALSKPKRLGDNYSNPGLFQLIKYWRKQNKYR